MTDVVHILAQIAEPNGQFTPVYFKEPRFPELPYALMDEHLGWDWGQSVPKHLQDKRYGARLDDRLAENEGFFARQLASQKAIKANDDVIARLPAARQKRIAHWRKKLEERLYKDNTHRWHQAIAKTIPANTQIKDVKLLAATLVEAGEKEAYFRPEDSLWHPLEDEYPWTIPSEKVQNYQDSNGGCTPEWARMAISEKAKEENDSLLQYFPEYWLKQVEDARRTCKVVNESIASARDSFDKPITEEQRFNRHRKRQSVRITNGCEGFEVVQPLDELRHLATLSITSAERSFAALNNYSSADANYHTYSRQAAKHTKNATSILKTLHCLESGQSQIIQKIQSRLTHQAIDIASRLMDAPQIKTLSAK